MARSTGRWRRPRGSIETLPSGALRVRVYAGVDPLSGRRRYLNEVAYTSADAERALTRLLAQVYEHRQPKTNATLNQLLDRWLEVADLEATTREDYVQRLDKHVRPALGNLPAGRVDAEMLETFYAQLRRCRDRCDGRRRAIEHAVDGQHDCTKSKCRRHECRGLAAASIRKIHYTLSAAYERGVRWRWLAVNPTKQTKPPPPAPASPTPPDRRGRRPLLDKAWSTDPEWGLFLWLAMTTGARRGELCGGRWRHVDLASGILAIERNVVHAGGDLREKGRRPTRSAGSPSTRRRSPSFAHTSQSARSARPRSGSTCRAMHSCSRSLRTPARRWFLTRSRSGTRGC
jgi:integrase